jgi:serine/threonine protein kinase
MSELPRPLALDLICQIAKSVATALDVANAAGHPHRDVKPANIIELVGDDGKPRWVLADWGLTRRALGQTTAKVTNTGQFLGSEGFAPPESYLDPHHVGLPGDIYSLGQVIAWAAGVEPVPNISPTVGPPWVDLVAKLTHQQVGARPQTIADVQRLLAEVCGSVQ